MIDWLFLLQVIAAFGLAAAVLVSGSRPAGAAGAGFALSTLAGYLQSVWIGLFGRPPTTGIPCTPASPISPPARLTGNNLNLNGGLWHEISVSG